MKYEDRIIKVRVGQVWKKRDTGQTVEITGKKKDQYWSTRKTSGKKKTHGIYEKDLWLWWELEK